MSKKIVGEDGKNYKVKKPFYKKVWFWILIIIILGGMSGALKDDKKTSTTSKSSETETSSSKVETTINLTISADEFEADESSLAIINGNTNPGARVSIGLGVVGDSVTADESGNFSLSYDMTSKKNKQITIYSTLDGESESAKVTVKPNANVLAAAQQEEQAKKEADNLPTEYKSALKKANSYSKNMHMSRQGIYNQLTSEYGEQFSPEAGQYAIDNLQADYNANALAKAKSYQDSMAMSPEAIRDQLTSEHGEQFTPEEADYAIQHLND